MANTTDKKPLTAEQKSKLLKAADEARERCSKRNATRGSLHAVDGRHEETDESGVPFGNTELGQGVGCALVILAIGLAVALMIWAAH